MTYESESECMRREYIAVVGEHIWLETENDFDYHTMYARRYSICTQSRFDLDFSEHPLVPYHVKWSEATPKSAIQLKSNQNEAKI